MRLALQPRHWPVGAGFVVLRLIILLPFPVLMWAGKWIGRLMYRLAKQRRHVAETNLALCFPQLSRTETDTLVKKVFESAGMAILETPLSWWGKTSRLKSLAHIHGMEHIEKAKTEGRAILLLGAHFTCTEIGGRLLAIDEPTVNMYKKHRNRLFEAVMRKNRIKHLAGLIQRHDVRNFVRTLKEGKVCWFAPDQDFGRKNSVFAPFMGVPAATLTATARIAKMSNAVVIPFFPTRRADARGYNLDILPPLENFPSGNDVEDATRINQVIAEHVKGAPDQYLWLHRRFKTQPDGQAAPY
ncbi:MAG: LpxL/LpxP family Kdo(2)-lipid IV(A) lauroyl/palmitoleoyl acyltransferase [Gammaproteobacteria bacterium]